MQKKEVITNFFFLPMTFILMCSCASSQENLVRSIGQEEIAVDVYRVSSVIYIGKGGVRKSPEKQMKGLIFFNRHGGYIYNIGLEEREFSEGEYHRLRGFLLEGLKKKDMVEDDIGKRPDVILHIWSTEDGDKELYVLIDTKNSNVQIIWGPLYRKNIEFHASQKLSMFDSFIKKK